MKLLVLFLFVAPCFANKEFCPNCYKYDDHCHKLAYLFDLPGADWGITLKIGLLRTNNNLLYSFYTKASSSEIAKTGYIKLDKPEINGIVYAGKDMHFLTFDIDQENELIYLGATDGLYVLNKENMLSLAGANNSGTITDIAYVKDRVFYITSRNQQRTINGVANPNLRVTRFVVTNNNLAVFLANTDKSRLYVTNGIETCIISESIHNGLAKDKNDNVYSWTDEGIYKIIVTNDLMDSTVIKVLDIEKVQGLTFDNSNNIIFNIGRALFKLTRTETAFCVKTSFVHCSE